jgi:tryptophan synthase beta chain
MPDYILACVGGGSNAIGIFYSFLKDKEVKLVGIEASGKGIESGEHSATLSRGAAGVFHGMRTYLLQDVEGQVQLPYSLSAGLDYPGVGPEHSFLKDQQRVDYVYADDQQALDAAKLLTRLEGIIPALESAHALAYLEELMPKTESNDIVVINLSGRGDKDMNIYSEHLK